MDQETLRRKLAEHRPSLQQARGEFAVLVPLVEGPEGLSLLYEVRPAKLHHHSGEVCFPGGRMEPGETPRQCALRETREELGIPAERIELLAHPPAIYRYPLRPEIGADFPYDKVGAAADYPWQAGHMEVPVYEGLPYPLWGLTARITWWLLERYGDILTGML